MVITDIQLYNSLREKLGNEQAQELVGFIREEIKTEFMGRKDAFLVKEDKTDIMICMKQDKVDIMRTIYVVGLVQFLAIVGAILAIINFMK
jgi:hypothetical protein